MMRLLTITRGKPPFCGSLALPGGFIERSLGHKEPGEMEIDLTVWDRGVGARLPQSSYVLQEFVR